MTKTILFVTLAAGLVLSACNRRDDTILFDGQAFRAKADAIDKDDRRTFTATISPVSASLEGAIEAGRYEGTKYCIANYGTSVIDWAVGPETEVTQLVVDGDTLTFQGTCKP
jgi:hypothetical protein